MKFVVYRDKIHWYFIIIRRIQKGLGFKTPNQMAETFISWLPRISQRKGLPDSSAYITFRDLYFCII